MMVKILDWVALILLIIAGLNLGLVGIFDYDVIIHIFADYHLIAHFIFCLMGISAIYLIFRINNLLGTIEAQL